jgi:hypothetical protein
MSCIEGEGVHTIVYDIPTLSPVRASPGGGGGVLNVCSGAIIIPKSKHASLPPDASQRGRGSVGGVDGRERRVITNVHERDHHIFLVASHSDGVHNHGRGSESLQQQLQCLPIFLPPCTEYHSRYPPSKCSPACPHLYPHASSLVACVSSVCLRGWPLPHDRSTK